jgi:hypothetical protein
MSYQTSLLQQSFIEWLKTIKFHNAFAVTIGMRKSNKYQYSRCLKHLINRINKKCFGNSYKRFGNGFDIVSVREGDDTYPHYHLIIDNKTHIPPTNLHRIIRNEWNKCDLGLGDYVDVRKMDNDGWIGYIAKHRSKPLYDEAIDWENIHIKGR